MKLPDKDSPFWKHFPMLIATVLAAFILGLRMAFAYNNPFDETKDTVTILANVATFVGAFAAADRFIKPS
jgi:hypothetical protein